MKSVRFEIEEEYWLEASGEDPVRGLRPILLAVGSEHHEAPPVGVLRGVSESRR